MARTQGKVAALGIRREDVVSVVFSIKYLSATRNKSDAPLRRLIKFFKAEDLRRFNMKMVRLGHRDDPYIVSYYQEGVRYRLLKDGRCEVESADAENDMNLVSQQMSDAVDTIIVDELVGRANSILDGVDKIIPGKSKISDDNEEQHHNVLLAVSMIG